MSKKCQSCHSGMPTFNKEQCQKMCQELDGWSYNIEKNCISKTFQFKGFYQTMSLVNAIAWIAQQQGHHPDMQVSYGQVIVEFTTHEAGGVSENDFISAKEVEALFKEES